LEEKVVSKWPSKLEIAWLCGAVLSLYSLKKRNSFKNSLEEVFEGQGVVGFFPSHFKKYLVTFAKTYLGASALWALLKLAGHLLNRYRSPIGAAFTTRFVRRTLTASSLSSSQQRQVFVDTPLSKSQPISNHTHGASAADRNAGAATGEMVAYSLGLTPYFVQESLADQRKGRDGDRSFHWPKDLAITPSEFHFDCTEQAAVLVDVDYYIDMPTLLARHPGTYLVAAFQPSAAGKSTGEYTFRFLRDGSVEYLVAGGAKYMSGVWDYSGDTFLVEDVGLLTKSVCAYHIDRKYIDEHHCLILLSLIGKFEMPSIVPTSLVLEGKRLERLMPIADNHVVLDVVKPDGIYRSVALLGDHEAVTLPMAQLDAIRAVAIVAKQTVAPSTVASNIMPSTATGLPTEKLPPGHAAILTSICVASYPTALLWFTLRRSRCCRFIS
jgi:hypothetical protein